MLVLEAPYLGLYLFLLTVVRALLQCPDYIGWEVIPQDGADGSWHIPGDLVLSRTSMPDNETYAALTFNLISAFDNTSLPCHANGTFADPDSGELDGTCDYPEGGVMGNTSTSFTYTLDASVGDGHVIYIEQNFSCIWNNHSRPYRTSRETEDPKVYPTCNASGSLCTMNQSVSIYVYSGPIYSAPPLTNCTAASLHNPTWTVTNITYSSGPIDNFLNPQAPPDVGTAFVSLAMSDIDFTMRCSPSSRQLALDYTGPRNDTWYDCLGDYLDPPDTPPTWIKFNQFTFEVNLKQSWTCDGTGPAHPLNFTGIGSVAVPYACDGDTSHHPGDEVECWSTSVTTILPNISSVIM